MKKIFAMIACMSGISGLAQHYQFSQFYAAPMYLNPAFTGANVCSRFSLNYRSQWTGIPGTFNTYQVSYDHQFTGFKSGIGVQLFNDVAGVSSLRTTQFNLLYSYETRIDKHLMGRGGISIGSVQRNADYSTFIFGDQIARNDARTTELLGTEKITYMDISTGFLLFSKSTWIGLAGFHLNEPNQSLMQGSSPLPSEYKVHGGYKLTIRNSEPTNRKIPNTESVTFAFNFKAQRKFRQLDLGVYYTKNLFVVGCWYRGIPIFRPADGYQNNDAVIFLIGINMDRYKIGYSYDFTLSKLSNAITRGSNELSMSWQLCKVKKFGRKKRNVLISCPKF